MNIETKKIIRKKRKKAAPKTKKKIQAYVIEYLSFYFVITGFKAKSVNRKTGEMIQTYLLDKETLTTEPKVFGAKCAGCPMVSKCYVSNDKMSVRRTVKKLLNGEACSYKFSTLDEVLPLLRGERVRLGTYGDPSALPLHDLQKICKTSDGWTGYTHFFREIDSDYSLYLMASVESLEGELLAHSLGYLTFRVLLKEDENLEVTKKSIQCLNVENDKTLVSLQCVDCLICSGTKGRGKKSVYIEEH
jgi:hypothetical protein